MAFLFKSKKHPERGPASRDGHSGSQGSIQSAGGRVVNEKSALQHRATPTGSMTSMDNDGSNGSPDHGHSRRAGSTDQTAQPVDAQQTRNGTSSSNTSNASLYPWSQRRLTYTSNHPSPFPRYGAAVNAVSSKEGDVYLMGGLINSSTVKGDLWMIEAGGNMACYPLATTAEGPGPRVGHSSLLVGNAFIVYGGDTKIEESDVLDETLYLLNTSTRQWSRALPAGPRPSGRYGHTLNILGSKIFVFGGQVEGYFMNDLSAFDLNQLQMPNNRWDILVAGEASPNIPAARTNHTMVTYNDKMYLFGGTNGFQWFNDVWCYDPAVNKWTQLDCIGYIPAPREGHAAALVDDVMYVFGGRTEDGNDLGDLAAFRLSSRRWYTFQNMGPSPSSRSGHSMTSVGKSIVVLGGEPSSATTTVSDLGLIYVLDTSKIRYPNDNQSQGPQRLQQGQGRRPSAGEANNPGSRQHTSRDGSTGPPESRRMTVGGPSAPPSGHRSPPNGVESQAPAVAKGPRAAPVPPAGPPPQGPMPARPTVDTSAVARVRGQSTERGLGSPKLPGTQSPVLREAPINETESPITNGRRTPTQTPARAGSKNEHVNGEVSKSKPVRPNRPPGSIDSTAEPALRPVQAPTRPASPPAPTRQVSNPLSRRASNRNSQTVVLLKELDSSRNRNAWYASELELARKAGYVPNTSYSTILDNKATEAFDDEDRPLIEALLTMRTELANVQNAVDKQAVVAAKQVAEAEKQRDAAIQEAVYSKAKLVAYTGGSASSTPQLGSEVNEKDESWQRTNDINRKLAASLQLHKDLQARLDTMKADLDSEKKARQLAEETTNAAQKRMTDLETYKQQTSTDVERLKAELHAAQQEAREKSVSAAESVAALDLLRIEKDDWAQKFEEAAGSSKDHEETFESLRTAIVSSEESHGLLEAKLAEERGQREKAETQLNKLKFEHETRTAELVAATQRLRDAEELAEKHAAEARTHRQAVLSGLDKISTRDIPQGNQGDAARVSALETQVATSNALVKKYQQEADSAADKLRGAEERIAGLEQYQEQSSREGVTIRRQLQSALRDTQSLQAANSDLKNQLAAQQLETNAMTVQHTALKDILAERGISPTGAIRARGLNSPRNNSPDVGRSRELEAQLANANAAHEETKQAFAIQAQESEATYREKLAQLESDYQSAVHYVKGTEKMLKQLKDQLARYKTENGRLKSEMVTLEDKAKADGEKAAASVEWEAEKAGLESRIEGLESKLHSSRAEMEERIAFLQQEVEESKQARELVARNHDEASRKLESHRMDLEQLQSENSLLEQRATDAEQKVALLLDQVEHSVDNYRRRSRQVPSLNSETVAANGVGLGHARTESSEGESIYGGNTGHGLEARNSAALDNLADELETLRSQWEATNKNYRLSTNFDFESGAGIKKEEELTSPDVAISDSLADWRKRLETEENQSEAEKEKKSQDRPV